MSGPNDLIKLFLISVAQAPGEGGGSDSVPSALRVMPGHSLGRQSCEPTAEPPAGGIHRQGRETRSGITNRTESGVQQEL